MTPAVLVVDLQVDYFSDDGLARHQDRVVAACNRLVVAARTHGVPVVEVVTEHRHDRSTWALNMLEDGCGMTLEGTEGARRLPELDVAGADRVVKIRDSAFHRTDLAELLTGLGVDTVVLVGVSTEACLSATASDAYAHDLRVVLVEDAMASVDPERHERALKELVAQYRQRRRDVDQVVHSWGDGGGASPSSGM
ncbi:cysteine hydrolase family protein [Nocardioides sp. Leaf307]|uniref:cysteine hydrolase family protein n=1 Tax=Nocardioides sp. Leaf307 TaxID=1736331 RepID=UPI00070336D0|nr:isochorismatase family cysteine hydrolase [Nocardioides sp. Leaf307]KQQ42757.1 hypothetical protein ASF50_01560 [Nocardioides sp. Leaf307]